MKYLFMFMAVGIGFGIGVDLMFLYPEESIYSDSHYWLQLAQAGCLLVMLTLLVRHFVTMKKDPGSFFFKPDEPPPPVQEGEGKNGEL